ncbi:glutathione S-transferase [Trichoderma chlorosporum]
MSAAKPLILHAHTSGPNPWKVVMILEELAIPYELVYENITTIKVKPYTDINPNGRVPALQDPNTNITLWESGAIIEYLIDTYDKELKLTNAKANNKWLEKQYLFFQVSGQGPYFGQWTWFSHFHPEKFPSAIERYANEIKRVFGVLDSVLEGKEYLVGNKCTYADLSFITWAIIGESAIKTEEFDIEKEFPNYASWMKKLLAREAVAKTLELKKQAAAQ